MSNLLMNLKIQMMKKMIKFLKVNKKFKLNQNLPKKMKIKLIVI